VSDDQQALIAALEAQERTLVFTRFDNADAWRLGSAMVAAAIERNLPITIDIRRHGQQLFHVALPGTAADNDSWIERKVNVVNRFAAASYLVGRRLAARGTTLDHALGVEPRLFAAHGGAFPIRIKDVGVVGTRRGRDSGPVVQLRGDSRDRLQPEAARAGRHRQLRALAQPGNRSSVQRGPDYLPQPTCSVKRAGVAGPGPRRQPERDPASRGLPYQARGMGGRPGQPSSMNPKAAPPSARRPVCRAK